MAMQHATTVPIFTPAMLSLYERCPQQYFLKYVQKCKVPKIHNPALVCGNVAHTVLEGVLEVYRRTGGYPVNLRERIEDTLPSGAFPDGEAWATTVEEILGKVKGALSSIPATARVLAVERWLENPFPGSANCPPFTLRHRPDLIFEHEDPVLEHRDWKDGQRAQVDRMQQVAARIVVRRTFRDHLRLLSSTVFLSHGIVQIDELTRDQVCTEWEHMKHLEKQIMAERDWAPVSNALCPWCPFYQRGCALYEASDEGPDELTTWLEGAD